MLFVPLVVRVFGMIGDDQPGIMVAGLFNYLHRCASAVLARSWQLRGRRCGDVGMQLFVRGGLHYYESPFGAQEGPCSGFSHSLVIYTRCSRPGSSADVFVALSGAGGRRRIQSPRSSRTFNVFQGIYE